MQIQHSEGGAEERGAARALCRRRPLCQLVIEGAGEGAGEEGGRYAVLRRVPEALWPPLAQRIRASGGGGSAEGRHWILPLATTPHRRVEEPTAVMELQGDGDRLTARHVVDGGNECVTGDAGSEGHLGR